MDTVSEFDPQSLDSNLSGEASAMQALLDIIQSYKAGVLTEKQLNSLLRNSELNFQELSRFIREANYERTSALLSMPTSSGSVKNPRRLELSLSNKHSPSGSTIISPCPSLSISSSALTEALRLGITSLFGIFTIPTSLIYLHNYRCIMRGSSCSVILQSQSDTTNFDIVLPKKL